MKIAFIGGGNMGEAMLAAVLEKGLSTPEGIGVGDISTTIRDHLYEKYSVFVTEDNRGVAGESDIVVLAVKPQNLAAVIAELNSCLKPAQLVLSIVAGASIDTISRLSGHSRIVRAMPNMPARIGAGVSAWTASAGVTGEQKGWARAILGAMGKEIYFDDEKYLDMATAVSGSGPAYFFLLAESLVDAAVHIGLPRDAAGELVLQTMLGSAQLMQKSGKSPAELRQNVTSRGGTTAEALRVFEEGGFARLVQEAVRAAHQRARELGT